MHETAQNTHPNRIESKVQGIDYSHVSLLYLKLVLSDIFRVRPPFTKSVECCIAQKCKQKDDYLLNKNFHLIVKY